MLDSTTPIVFLHAYPLDASMWDDQRAALGTRQTLAPNFPGFGDRPPGPATLDGFAETVLGEMDAAGIDRAIFVGLSMGGYVAFRIHERWPHRVAALVLADTRAGADSPEAAERRTEQAARVRREGTGWLPDAMLPNVLGESVRTSQPDVVERTRRMILAADPEGVARAAIAMRDRPDSTETLATIRVPVLVLVGDEDTLTPLDEARKIAERIEGARLEVVPRAGHLSNLENPEVFGDLLSAFIG